MTLRRAIALAGAALLCFSGVVGVSSANPTPAEAWTFSQKPCTDWKSEISPPETIRVLRTRSGAVEIVPFRDYVLRTHAREFWSEYFRSPKSPYSDALLGVAAISVKQNAWAWTMRADKDWWGISATTASEREWVYADLADDNRINGSKGNPALKSSTNPTVSAQTKRASQNFKLSVEMRMRFGADMRPDGIGDLSMDRGTGTYTLPLAVYDSSGNIVPVAQLPLDTPRSCFDITDEPSVNQFYSTGGFFEPGQSHLRRYNAAVNATWGVTIQRLDTKKRWPFMRPGFYGSWNGVGGKNSTSACLLPPKAGQTKVNTRHATQPSHFRGASMFVENADACAKKYQLSVEELLRWTFWQADGTATGPTPYSTKKYPSSYFRINSIEPVKIISPGIDLTGDGKGDFIATGPDGSVKFLSSDTYVGKNGRLRNRVPGTVSALAGATLIDREIARTERDGGLSVLSLWRAANGATSLIKTPISSGVLGTSVTILNAYTGFDTTASLSLDVADTSADIIQEFFIAERTPNLSDVAATRLRLFEIIAGSAPTQLIEAATGPDAVTVVRDVTGDGVPDATILWRASDGALMVSQAFGSLSFSPTTSWVLSAVSTPGALLWPIASRWSVTAADALGDAGSELYVSYRDLNGIAHIVRLAMSETDPAATPSINPDLIFTPEAAPPLTTTVLKGETTLAKVALRLGYKSGTVAYNALYALNTGSVRLEKIQRGDTYAKIAKRVRRSEGCLRSMNPKSSKVAYPAKVLVVGKMVNVPVDAVCVYTSKSIMYRGAPVRILASETDKLQSGDTWETIAARATTVGVVIDAAGLAVLNPTITDLTTAAVGTEVRIRAPWVAVVRSSPPAAPLAVGARTYAWGSPVEVWKATASGSAPILTARDWTGDGILDLFFTGISSTGSASLVRLGYSGGRLVQKEKVVRTSVGKGWTLQ